MQNIPVDRQLASKFTAIRSKFNDTVNDQFAKRVRGMFGDLVRHSPQWSGDFASNWYITQNEADYKYLPNVMKGYTTSANAREMGDMDSLRSAIARANLVKLNYLKTVYFANDTPIAFEEEVPQPYVSGLGQPYAGARFPDHTKVRPENLVDGRVALGSWLYSKYSA